MGPCDIERAEKEHALAAETAFTLHEYMSTRSTWCDRILLAQIGMGLYLTESSVQRETRIRVGQEEMGIRAPERVVQF